MRAISVHSRSTLVSLPGMAEAANSSRALLILMILAFEALAIEGIRRHEAVVIGSGQEGVMVMAANRHDKSWATERMEDFRQTTPGHSPGTGNARNSKEVEKTV